jgi:polar amino acid transport system substrate-binding protein
VTTVDARELADGGTLEICADIPSPPFASRTRSGLVGFEIELVERIARRLDLQPAWRDTARPALVRDLLAGQCDIVAAQLPVSYALQARIAMMPYLQVDQAFLAREADGPRFGDPAADPGRLCGLSVAVVADGREERTALEYDEQCRARGRNGIDLVRVATPRAAIAALRSGRAELVFDDQPRVEWYASHGDGLARVGGSVDHVNYAFGLGRGLDSLYFALRAGVRSLQEDGTFVRLQERFGLESARILALP